MAFKDIFRDDTQWNEKTIIGFISFAVMVLTSFVDLLTGIFGKSLIIHEYVYQSFVVVTLGSFGIAGAEKFSGTERIRAKARVDSDMGSEQDIPPDEPVE